MSSEQTAVYVIHHPGKALRKVGLGVGSRLDKWRSEGWTIEQTEFFPSRQHAAFLEFLVVRTYLSAAGAPVSSEEMPDGFSEAWPDVLGAPDLLALKKAVQAMELSLTDRIGILELAGIGTLRAEERQRFIEAHPDEFRRSLDDADGRADQITLATSHVQLAKAGVLSIQRSLDAALDEGDEVAVRGWQRRLTKAEEHLKYFVSELGEWELFDKQRSTSDDVESGEGNAGSDASDRR